MADAMPSPLDCAGKGDVPVIRAQIKAGEMPHRERKKTDVTCEKSSAN